MTQNLAPKVASIFQLGFDGAVKLLVARGYPPAGEDTSYLNYLDAFAECPSEAFDL